MIFTQEVENLLRLCGFSEGGVAAQIAEHDDDLAAMAFEDLLVALRDDQFGKLRRQKSFQPPDAPQLLDLFRDPHLQAAVQFRDLVGALPQFAEQTGVLHRNDRLSGEVLQQRDLLFGKWAGLMAEDSDRAQELVIFAQRHPNTSPDAAGLYPLPEAGGVPIALVALLVGNADNPFARLDSSQR